MPDARVSPIATLFPGYFALVMATGIIAVAASQQDLDWLADALYIIAVIAYAVLLVLLTIRIVRYWPRFTADLTNHARGFAFLTLVAATNVLAAASVVIHGWSDVGWVLWWASLVFWVLLLYATLIAVVIRADKPGLAGGINGSWFLLTVSTESVAVVAGLQLATSSSDLLAFVALAAFTLGIVLYLIVMTMVFLRWTFQDLDPTEADPPAWIAAGAVAITVHAGSNLLLASSSGPERLTRLAPFIEAAVVMAWATATFWFPLMIAIGVWRHIVRRVPLRYHPSYWAMVFPLGMYGAATFRMRAAIDLEALEWLPKVVLAVALVAWAVTFVGLGRHLAVNRRHGQATATAAR
jgi:tellurite resistance protein TehA-like permease